MILIDLLENYIIFKEKDREKFYEIKDNIHRYKNFIKNNLSYDLIIKEDFIKLEKIPSDPQAFMGIKEFEKKEEYIFFMLLLMFLEDKNKEEQFILSNLTEYIYLNYTFEKVDWTKFVTRKSLVNVIKVAINLGVIKKNDGEEESFEKNYIEEVLYENTGVSRYIVRNFQMEIDDIKDYTEILSKSNLYVDKHNKRKINVYRSLTLSPIVYNEKEDDGSYDYIKKYRSNIIPSFENNLGWNIDIHKNGALVVLKNSNEVKDTFPNNNGESSAVLIINCKIHNLIKDKKLIVLQDDTIVIKRDEFENILLQIRKEDGHGFVKYLRDCSDDLFISKVSRYMKDFSMIREDDENIIIMPLISKVVGKYPADYKGV